MSKRNCQINNQNNWFCYAVYYEMACLIQLSFLCLFFISISFGSPVDNRIHGGFEAKPGQFPYQASLRTRSNNNNFPPICGGSILSERFIITAAHCVPKEGKLFVLIGGHHKHNINLIDLYEVKTKIVHEKFNHTSMRNDIALLELVKPIQFNNTVKPIPINKEFLGGGLNATASGWGTSNVSTNNMVWNRKM